MSNNPYKRLRERMDQFPIGFPETESGVELKILKRLFTEEEAAIALLLSPFPEETARIAERADLDEAELSEKLKQMAERGLVFRVQRKGKILFNMAPFMIGLYEYSVKRIDTELAALFKEYYDTAMQYELASPKVAGFKVIPVAEHIAADTILEPYHELEGKIREARKIAVTDCVCRKEAHLLGHGCEHPVENCLSFGAAAEYYIDSGLGRGIEAEEALTILREADESGLVHAGANAKHLSNICNCCPCCCASLKPVVAGGSKKSAFFNSLYEAVIDENECTACEACVERCPVEAIQVEEIATADRDLCLGCGLCAGVCPCEAISMHLRPDRDEPFDHVVDMGMAILESKKNKG